MKRVESKYWEREVEVTDCGVYEIAGSIVSLNLKLRYHEYSCNLLMACCESEDEIEQTKKIFNVLAESFKLIKGLKLTYKVQSFTYPIPPTIIIHCGNQETVLVESDLLKPIIHLIDNYEEINPEDNGKTFYFPE